MNSPCPFDEAAFSFPGSALEQARCLLRFVRRGGDVDDTPATLPPILQQLLATPETLDLSTAQLRQYVQAQQIPEETVGGSFDDPVARADSNNSAKPFAQYFIIHDTSRKLGPGDTFDSVAVDSAQWSGNVLANLAGGKTHIYINRLGETKTDHEYSVPWRATKFEGRDTIYRGYFLHHELVQPRVGPGESDIDAPTPGFTPKQYARLALQYLIASVRRGSWMIPGFHGVLDLHIGDHDDPQRFDLSAWGHAIEELLNTVRQ